MMNGGEGVVFIGTHFQTFQNNMMSCPLGIFWTAPGLVIYMTSLDLVKVIYRSNLIKKGISWFHCGYITIESITTDLLLMYYLEKLFGPQTSYLSLVGVKGLGYHHR